MGEGPFQRGNEATRDAAHHVSERGEQVVVGTERVVLTPIGGVWWPGAATLIVADLHLGRTEAMGARGVAMPAVLMDQLLATIAHEAHARRAERLLVLGDLLHAPIGITTELVERVAAWRRALACTLVVVPGNHDRRIERVEHAWDMTITETTWCEGAFEFAHDPCDLTCRGAYGWCGHVHPAVTMRHGPDAVKLRAFHVGERFGVLPAMCPLASGGSVTIDASERIFAIAEHQVLEVRSSSSRASARRSRP